MSQVTVRRGKKVSEPRLTFPWNECTCVREYVRECVRVGCVSDRVTSQRAGWEGPGEGGEGVCGGGGGTLHYTLSLSCTARR